MNVLLLNRPDLNLSWCGIMLTCVPSSCLVPCCLHSEVGRVVGGTKGNPVLEYISGAPNKPIVIEDEPNIFDYDQLTKYGYDVSDRLRMLVEASLR